MAKNMVENEEKSIIPIFCILHKGSGNFGTVFSGTLTRVEENVSEPNVTKVAIKELNDKANDKAEIEFFKEAIAVSKLDHENIMRFFGVCHELNYLVFELMEGPQLLKYLRSIRDDYSLGELVMMSFDLAKGLAYLQKMKCVHRDIAARNCMLTSIDPNFRIVS